MSYPHSCQYHKLFIEVLNLYSSVSVEERYSHINLDHKDSGVSETKLMTMSRKIPISVHPEYGMRATNETQGKPRIFARSLSLPCGPTDRLVTENLNPAHANLKQFLTAENTQNTAEMPIQNITRNDHDGFSEFWETGFPEYSVAHAFSEDVNPGKLHLSEETEQRSYFFSESPVVRDLEMFEDYYTSDPSHSMKLARRNTYGADSSGKNSEGFHSNKPSFIIPIRLEFDEGKHNGKEALDPKKSNAQTESAVQVLGVDGVQIEPKTGGTANHNLENEDCVMEKPDESSKETDWKINNTEANTEQDQDDALNANLRCTQVRSPSTPKTQPVEDECDETEKKLSIIQSITNKAQELEKEVNVFSDTHKTKKYLILEEVLTCCLIDLDGIEANQDEHVRKARKKGVQLLQQILARLEGRIIPESVENGKKQKVAESLKISA